jgi:hypothetical protein
MRVTSWKEFYRWLGERNQKWGSFTLESARELVPHWLGENVQFQCAIGRVASMFVESCHYAELKSSDLSFDISGLSQDEHTSRWLTQIADNLVPARRPIFAV